MLCEILKIKRPFQLYNLIIIRIVIENEKKPIFRLHIMKHLPYKPKMNNND